MSLDVQTAEGPNNTTVYCVPCKKQSPEYAWIRRCWHMDYLDRRHFCRLEKGEGTPVYIVVDEDEYKKLAERVAKAKTVSEALQKNLCEIDGPKFGYAYVPVADSCWEWILDYKDVEWLCALRSVYVGKTLCAEVPEEEVLKLTSAWMTRQRRD